VSVRVLPRPPPFLAALFHAEFACDCADLPGRGSVRLLWACGELSHRP